MTSKEAKRSTPTEFLSSLTSLLSQTHTSSRGSVFITQKLLLPSPSDTSPSPTTPQPQILLRATNGASKPSPKTTLAKEKSKLKKSEIREKIKLSTVIEQSESEEFFVKLAEVCKQGMVGMRKRERRGKKKGKGGKGKGGGGK